MNRNCMDSHSRCLCPWARHIYIFYKKRDAVNVDDIDPTSIVSETEAAIGDRVFGKTDSKAIAFEYADYQCPGCASAFQP